MDQTPLPWEYLSGRTYAVKGEKTVWTKGANSGWDKRQATLMLTVFADGKNYLKPVIIFKGTADEEWNEYYYGEEKKAYDPRVVVKFNLKGYANEDIMLWWFKEQLIPCLHQEGDWKPENPAPGLTAGAGGPRICDTPPPPCTGFEYPPSLVALDAASFHRTPTVKNKLRENNVVPSLIPGGCTGLVQVLDVAVNKPFKEILRQVIDELVEELMVKHPNWEDVSDSMVGQRRILMTKAVGEAWERFINERSEVVVKAFRQLGMSLAIDGSEDGELSVKGLLDIVIGEYLRGNDSDPDPSKDMEESEEMPETDAEHSEALEYVSRQ